MSTCFISPDTSKSKIINDPIYGHILHPAHSMKIVDTPQFQRLRDLQQLGCSYFVFPGASHHRFEHCLGVSYLAGKMLRGLRKRQPELRINERDMRCVQLAGLCHDLGHGPYSHAFEEWVHRRPENKNWHHEDMSIKMLDYLIDENCIDLSREDVRFMNDLIRGSPSGYAEKKFLFDIVSNSRNSVDVDKFDYLARDAYNLGMKSSYDCDRLMKYSRVIGDEICYHAKEAYNVYEVFHTRYSMFKHVYTHRTGKAIEYMIMDAFDAADDYLNITERIHEPSTFWSLTDSIIKTIEFSTAPELRQAREIVSNIRKRNLYQLAYEILIPKEHDQPIDVSAEAIAAYDANINADDIIVQHLQLNYAMKYKNPVDYVHFYSKWAPNESFSMPREKVSLLIPEQFAERYIRVFCKKREKTHLVQEAFEKLLGGSAVSPRRAFPRVQPQPFQPTICDFFPTHNTPKSKRVMKFSAP